MIKKYADYPIKNATKRNFKTKYFNEEDFKGYVSLLTVKEIGEQLEEDLLHRDIESYEGCKWLEMYPENSNVALTVAYNKENTIFDWYFDIINSVGIEDNNPYIEDMYLDVFLTPDGKITLLDEDDLKEALDSNNITKEQFDFAYKVARELINKIEGKIEEIRAFSNKYFEKINLMYTIKDEDIGEKNIPVEQYRIRHAARGIVIREDGKIAVFHKNKTNQYKLPGGGLEGNESPGEGFKREVLEETGCEVDLVDFLGIVEENKTHDNFKQISHIYIGKVSKDTKKFDFTKQEKIEGASLAWDTPENALNLIIDCFDKIVSSKYDGFKQEKNTFENSQTLNINVYYTKFEVVRDIKILEYYLKNYNKDQK